MLDPTRNRQQQKLSNVGLLVNKKKMQIMFLRVCNISLFKAYSNGDNCKY